MMTPYDEARAVYDREPCARGFDEDMLAHLRGGFVFSGPDGFVMGRAVQRVAPASFILDPWRVFAAPDCWHIWLAAGDWSAMLARYLPYPLPWFSWERKNRLHFWPAGKFFDKAGPRLRISSAAGEA